MKNLTCKHCGGEVKTGDIACPNCGIPLPPDYGKHPQRNFILWFIALVALCVFMIFWLPPDWSNKLLGR